MIRDSEVKVNMVDTRTQRTEREDSEKRLHEEELAEEMCVQLRSCEKSGRQE